MISFDGFSERWDSWFTLCEGKIRSPLGGGAVVAPDGTVYEPREPDALMSQSSARTPPFVSPNTTQDSPIVELDITPSSLVTPMMALAISDDSNGSKTFTVPLKSNSRDREDEEEESINMAHRILHRGKDADEETDRDTSTSSSLFVETGAGIPPRSVSPVIASGFAHIRRWASKEKVRESVTFADSFVVVAAASNIEAGPPLLGVVDTVGVVPRSDIDAERRGISGLVNLGNSCYMNAVLQSLGHISPFVVRLQERVAQVKDENSKKALNAESVVGVAATAVGGKSLVNKPDDRLAKALFSLYHDQWIPNPAKSRNPLAVKQLIGEVASQFQGTRQHDAQEMLVYLLDGLHEGLNRVKRRPTYVELNLDTTLTDDQIANEYWHHYERGNDSFVKDLLAGQIKSKVRCAKCHTMSTSFDVFWDLSLPLPVQDKSISVMDLLDRFCAPEKLENSGFNCSKCAGPCEHATKQLTIARFPKVLVLHLKRFSTPHMDVVKKINTSVTFPLQDLKVGNRTYDLVAAVNHMGTFYGGHYTADVYNSVNRTWYVANDEVYEKIDHPSKVGTNAYLIFYVEKKSDKAFNEMPMFTR